MSNTHPQSSLDVLRHCPLFGDLTRAELEEFAWTGERIAFETGQFLFRQGEPGEFVYAIAQGEIRLCMEMPGGGQVDLLKAGPGDLIGEMVLVGGYAHCSSSVAVSPGTALRIPARAFMVLRSLYRPGALKVLRRFARLTSERLREQTLNQSEWQNSQKSPAAEAVLESHSLPDAAAWAALRSSAHDLDRENLLRLPVFHALAPDELENLLQHMHQVLVPRGRILFRRGDPPNSCFIVVRGAVEAYLDPQGRKDKLALLGPGKLFGELALVDASPRSAHCATRENSILLEIEREQFERLFSAESPVVLKFFDAVARLMADSLQRANRRWARLRVERAVAAIPLTEIDAPTQI